MPSLFKSVAALAFAGAAVANPLRRDDDACLAAVTGKAALGDDNLRKEHCASFIKTIVTPAAITSYTTITDAPTAYTKPMKRDVTVCPNEVPNYASACDEDHYKSACSVYGYADETTVTIPATTTIVTVYGGYGGDSCTADKTVTVTAATATVTVTGAGGPGRPTVTGYGDASPVNGKCLSDDEAKEFVDAFIDLLSHTDYNGTADQPMTSSGYHRNVSAKYLADDFQDYSDSINWMAGIPLGSVTFDGRSAFDEGQRAQAELTMDTKFIHHSCTQITWRWHATTLTQASVMGINHMMISDDLTQIKTNYAEFDNGAWLYSFGLQCKVPGT